MNPSDKTIQSRHSHMARHSHSKFEKEHHIEKAKEYSGKSKALESTKNKVAKKMKKDYPNYNEGEKMMGNKNNTQNRS